MLRRSLFATALAGPAIAQPRPLRILTPFAAGGAVDTLARFIAARIQALTGQSVVVEPRPGAGGDLAMLALINAEPDGQTMALMSDGAMVRNPMLRRGLPFDPVRDFAPCARLVLSWYAFAVHADVPARSMAEFIAWARARPGYVNYGSAGPGTLAHVIGAMIARDQDIVMQHVPYRGANLAMQDLVAGRLQFYAVSAAGLLALLRDPAVRVLAVTGEHRQATLPDAPTIAAAGFPQFDLNAFFALGFSARVAPGVVAAMSELVGRVLAEAETARRLEEQGYALGFLPVEPFRTFLEAERARWRGIIARTGVSLEG